MSAPSQPTGVCWHAPKGYFRFGTVAVKMLVQDVRRDGKGMQAVAGAFELSLLPRRYPVPAHQAGNASAPDP